VDSVRRQRALLQLRRAPAAQAGNPVLIAASKALRDPATSHERGWVERIEQQRRTLVASTVTFTLEALGAKSTGSQERSIGAVADSASTKPRWAYLLFRVVREWRPVECVELGACVGISAAYHAAALELNGAGTIVTVEGTPALADQSRETLEALGLADRAEVVTGAFVDALPEVLRRRSGRIDYVFIDGHHDGAATLRYLEQILPHLSDQAVIAFDDIRWSDDMRRAWESIRRDERFASTVDLHMIGFAIWQRDRDHAPAAHLRLRYA
jgi:predicted O-methyltransferase YrrM